MKATDPAPSAPSQEVRAEAAAWLARLRAEDRDAADEAAFRTWLNASPVHASAFEAVDRMWSDVGGLTDLRADIRRVPPKIYQRRSTASRRALLAGVGLLAVTGGRQTGFKFGPVTTENLVSVLQRACASFNDVAAWRRIQRNGMSTDVSWRNPASRYANLYRGLGVQRQYKVS